MKTILTAEQITNEALSRASTMMGVRRVINRLFLAQDNSHLWPINGRFNVTKRAIRKAQWFERQTGEMSPLEYAYFLESEMSRIVNDPKWQ